MPLKELSVTKALKQPLKVDKGIVVLYGEEEFLQKNFLQKLKKEKGDYTFYHGEDLDIDKFIELLGERTLFSFTGGKIKVLWQGEKFFDKPRKKQKEKVSRLLKREIKDLIIVCILKDLRKTDKGKEPYKTLFEVSKAVFTAKSLNKTQIAALIKRKFQKEGIKIPEGAIEYLLESFSDLTALKNELEKLITYAYDKKELTLEEVKTLVEGNRTYTVFDFQKAFFDKNLKEVLKIYRSLLEGLTTYETTQTVLQLEGLILSTVNKLLIASERSEKGEELKRFAREIGLYYPFQIMQFQNWLKSWKREELEDLLKELFKFDLKVKTKFLPAPSEFEKFLLSSLS
jgi:DNA polymerase-3 subunit delta